MPAGHVTSATAQIPKRQALALLMLSSGAFQILFITEDAGTQTGYCSLISSGAEQQQCLHVHANTTYFCTGCNERDPR